MILVIAAIVLVQIFFNGSIDPLTTLALIVVVVGYWMTAES